MLDEFTKVKTFTEKPDLELAKVFMESGEFFWNSGLFVWNVNTILEAFSKFLPDISLRFDLGSGRTRFHRRELPLLPEYLHRLRDHGKSGQRIYALC